MNLNIISNALNKVKTDNLILSTNRFPVVGIGASAGGLEAFKKLLKEIPPDSGMAYVLVQHLDPNHESMLPELLQKVTQIPVLEISDDIKVLPNHVYIIPSNKMLIANDGVLELSPRITKKNERNLPIDLFFKSLAEVHQSHAIGVVLSGAANDGTNGLKDIKEHGGITFAQDEASAGNASMPNSAMKAGVVDFVLPPEEILHKLLEVIPGIHKSDDEIQELSGQGEDVFQQIINLIRLRRGTDFTYYKQTTIHRRILRRMALQKIESVADYFQLLSANKTEQDILYQDLLIPVTSFFRDLSSFDTLCESIFPIIIKNKNVDETIRIWAAGCSTGQEAYSIAICLKEFLGYHSSLGTTRKVQVFGTDISEPAIEKARSGIYSKNELEGLSAQRLQEFFIPINGGYQVIKQIREMCVFAVHDFLKDPPFGKMDFISCRNVLIYMEPYLQKKALTTFHYALLPKGFLWLGNSETISSVPELFSSQGKQDKMFIRKDGAGKYMLTTSLRSEKNLHELNSGIKNEYFRTDFQKVADEIILSKYTPAGVVVNELMDIVHFRGKTNDFLEQMTGKPSHNLFKMAKDSLAFELRDLLRKAKKNNVRSIKDNISLQVNGNHHTISIEVLPLPDTVDQHFLVLFHDHNAEAHILSANDAIKTTKAISSKSKLDSKDLQIHQLKHELEQTREAMRAISEDQEAVNEELQSANEEYLSNSEELQSLNEELETSKEELQSTNEELTVVNQEMIDLNIELTEARDYAEAIVTSIRTPLVVLDENFKIISANNAFYKTFMLNETETAGESIYEIGNKDWDIETLRILLEQILPEQSKITDYEVNLVFQSLGERTMLLNAHEIRRENRNNKLILLAIEDITERTQNLLKEKKHSIELEDKVQQRTSELNEANESQAQTNKELVSINKELQSFNYVSSHDLQEPLRKIQTFASHILEKELDTLSDKGKDYFNRMREAADRMQTLIEDLLNFSRLNNANRKFEDVDLAEVIGEVMTELQDLIQDKNATIKVTDMCNVKIIPFQFRQLMNNLICNALKFSSSERMPNVVIKSNIVKGNMVNDQLLPEKEYCHISVSDNGIGFLPQYSDQIFELFERLHDRDAYKGTGIGLSIVKKIVENHGGIITATGIPDKGATFDIYLPA